MSSNSTDSYLFHIKHSTEPVLILSVLKQQTLHHLQLSIKQHFQLNTCKLIGKPPFKFNLSPHIPLHQIWGSTNVVIVLSAIGNQNRLNLIQEQQLIEAQIDTTDDDLIEDTVYVQFCKSLSEYIVNFTERMIQRKNDTRHFVGGDMIDTFQMIQYVLEQKPFNLIRSYIVSSNTINIHYENDSILNICVLANRMDVFQYFHDTLHIPLVIMPARTPPLAIQGQQQQLIFDQDDTSVEHSEQLGPFGVRQPINLDSFNIRDKTPFYLAAMFGRMTFIQYFYETMHMQYPELAQQVRKNIAFLLTIACRYNQKGVVLYLYHLQTRFPFETVMQCAFSAIQNGNLDLLRYILRRLLPGALPPEPLEETTKVVPATVDAVHEAIRQRRLQNDWKTCRNLHWSYRWLLCALCHNQMQCVRFCVETLNVPLHTNSYGAVFQAVSLNCLSQVQYLYSQLPEQDRNLGIRAFDEQTQTNSLTELLFQMEHYYHSLSFNRSTDVDVLQFLLSVPVSIPQSQVLQFNNDVVNILKHIQLQLEERESNGQLTTQLLSLTGGTEMEQVYQQDTYLTLPSALSRIVAEYVHGADGSRLKVLQCAGINMFGEWRAQFAQRDAELLAQTELAQRQQQLNDIRAGILLPAPGIVNNNNMHD